MHYTADNFEVSIADLTGQRKPVSVHYVVPDPLDTTYIAAGFDDLYVFNLVDEKERAWHAGVSAWKNRTDLNDTSIGIEIVNMATEEAGKFIFPQYNPQQIEKVIALAHNILSRYPDITPSNVIGHADIAFLRKSDPGPAFPWEQLYLNGIGAWPDADITKKYMDSFHTLGLPAQTEIISAFAHYGYGIDARQAVSPQDFLALVRAFQMHFRPSIYSGAMDIETCAMLYALNDKYR